MGLMERMQASQEQYNPDDYIETPSLGTEIAPHLLRKLRSIAAQIDLATEIEDFQSIGVQSREIQTADEKSSVVCFYLFRKDSTGRTGGFINC